MTVGKAQAGEEFPQSLPVTTPNPRDASISVTPPTHEALERVWATPKGIVGWFTAVNHRDIGVRYILTAFAFFVLAGIIALVMRVQLAYPQLEILSPELYNQFFTMHGTTMMFLFAVPMVEGFGIYLVPLMIGARDMAFPRLNAFGYWVFLIAGVVLFISLFMGVAPDGGWFNYVPLTGPGYSPAINIDLWVTMVTFLEVAALVAAIELIVTIVKMRAPGMALHQTPIFVWGILVMAVMIVFAMPPLMVASIMLELDRKVGTHFYNAAVGGDPLLWQHLFWFFGHPEVYIILIPALGIVSSIVVTFTRRPLIGYSLVAVSLAAIGALSFGLWVHHMFATGLRILGMTIFTAASLMIAIPSGIQIFSIIGTIWAGSIRLTTPMLFVLGFIFIFVLGGLSGVMVASIPFNLQVHDTYFVVAHFHYVIVGGMLFPVFGGLYYWWPKMTGRLLSERLGKWNFWVMIIGFNVGFFFMHNLGFMGMPRRIYTYLPYLGWDVFNLVSTFGAFIFGAGVSIFIANVIWSHRRGEKAGYNPWGAPTLEWATSSPPPQYNFLNFAVVSSREPLWEPGWQPDARQLERGEVPHVVLPIQGNQRDSLATTFEDARPDHRVVLPKPSVWPLLTALAVSLTFLSILVDLILVPIGAVLIFCAVLGWNWPRKEDG